MESLIVASTRCWRGVRPVASGGPSGISMTFLSSCLAMRPPLASTPPPAAGQGGSGAPTVDLPAPQDQTPVRSRVSLLSGHVDQPADRPAVLLRRDGWGPWDRARYRGAPGRSR